ncbi:MAG: FAD-binding oxidoreductase, partial [Lachnospiraceae bacterium]|nr:FAD-binding oxidoreductase [Lachnospiraceae bacterium]
MYSSVIIGAGLYGLYAALYCAKKSRWNSSKIVVLEKDSASFTRATYINQARVHMGYHYPRSLSTAEKSAQYFYRFMEDYGFCVLTEFDQVYATSSNFSWTNAQEFKQFCKNVGIRCDGIDPNQYFKPGMCDGAFLTEEYTYDAHILQQYLLEQLSRYSNVEIVYGAAIGAIEKTGSHFVLKTSKGTYKTDFLLNATYASSNEIIHMLQ